MKMAEFEAFACPCGRGDVVLRESHQPKTCGKLYYACPLSQPRSKDYGCGFFLWKEKRLLLMTSSPIASASAGPSRTPPYSPGPSTSSPRNAECSNCIKLNHRIMVLEKMLEMYMDPQNHTVQSASLFHDLYNDMDNLSLE